MPSIAKLNPRVRAQLERTPQIAVVAASRAMEEGAQEIVSLMKQLVPVRYGNLRDSIGWTWGNAPAGTVKIDTIKSGKNEGLQYGTIKITFYAGNRSAGFDKAFYAHMVEFGTSPHYQPNLGRMHPGTTAQPFFYPAWRTHKAKFKRKIRAAVRRAIKEAINV